MSKLIGMCGIVGLGGGFLSISPNLRESLTEQAAFGLKFLDTHSPYSYVGVGVLAVIVLMSYMSRASAPR